MSRNGFNIAPSVLTGTQCRVLSTWGLGSGLVSQVPCLGDALEVAGDKKKNAFNDKNVDNFVYLALPSMT